MTLEVEVEARAPVPLRASVQVGPGQILALVGPSGAGKTTLLRMIAGLARPERGRIRAGGATWLDTSAGLDLPPHRRRLGYVVQSYALFPHLSAAGNVMAAMDRPDRAEAERLLALVNLPGLADRRPAALSGGQQQRVALARALARRPDVLLLDEPFAAVDQAVRERLQGEILALRAHLAMPVVLVTHDLAEAQVLADRMAVLDGGRVVAQGSAATVLADPAALRVLGLREAAALLPATLAEHLPDGLTRFDTAAGPLWMPAHPGPLGLRVRVRVLAHEVILARARPEGLSAQTILPGRVAQVVPGAGPGVMVHVALGPVGQDLILARVTRRAADQLGLAPGVEVHAILKAMSVARDQVAPRAGGQAAETLE